MFRVKVPATSANICCGLDTFGMAVTLYNTFYFSESEEFIYDGKKEDIETTNNLVLKSYLIDININDSVFTINTDEAKGLISDALDSEFNAGKSNGMEEVLEFENSEGLGKIYTYQDEMIHMSYFKNASEKIAINDKNSEGADERIIF